MSGNESKTHIPVVPRRPSRNASAISEDSLKCGKENNSSTQENSRIEEVNSENYCLAQDTATSQELEDNADGLSLQENNKHTTTSLNEYNDDHEVICDDKKNDFEDSQDQFNLESTSSAEDPNLNHLLKEKVSKTDPVELQSLTMSAFKNPTLEMEELSESNFPARPSLVSEADDEHDVFDSKKPSSEITDPPNPSIIKRSTSESIEQLKPNVPKRPSFEKAISSKPVIPQRPSHLKMKPTILNKSSPQKKLPAKPMIPQRPCKTELSSNEVKEKQPPPIVPKKPSSKILAFQTMLAQQQREQTNFTAKPLISKKGTNSVANELSEDSKQSKRAEFAKNLNGIFGVALPGMTPSGFPGKLTKDSGSNKEENKDNIPESVEELIEKEPRKPATKRGRIGLKGRRLPSTTTKKVDATIPDKKYSTYVANIWEVNV